MWHRKATNPWDRLNALGGGGEKLVFVLKDGSKWETER